MFLYLYYVTSSRHAKKVRVVTQNAWSNASFSRKRPVIAFGRRRRHATIRRVYAVHGISPYTSLLLNFGGVATQTLERLGRPVHWPVNVNRGTHVYAKTNFSTHTHAHTTRAHTPSVPKLCPGAEPECDRVFRLLVQAFPPELLRDLLEPLLLLRQHLRGQDDLAGDVVVFYLVVE